MEKSIMTYLILKNLYSGRIVSYQELGLNNMEYAEILDLMQKENLITGVVITSLDQERLLINNQNEAITVAGINYLMENTLPDREYKIQVSVDETVSGTELCTTANIKGRTCKYKKTFSKPAADIDIETEAFILMAEGLKREKDSI